MSPTIAGVPWALRQIGKLSVPLNRAASNVARRLVKSGGATTRWIGRDVLAELESAAVHARLARRKMTKPSRGRHTEGGARLSRL